MTNDSSDMMNYAQATDPVYWIESNSSDVATLFVKPTPTYNQPAKVYHITYPTIDASVVSIIANFPDEAEYLVVNYASIKALSYLMNQISNDELDLVTDFADANNWLNTEEDSEMVNSRISVISSQINDFNTKRKDKDMIYRWYKDQYGLLKQDYAMGLKMLTQGSLELRQEQGARA